jgi:prepilin-type N-terminal cleavage/methylation domain-containing protein
VSAAARRAGFTLVELLIAMVIGAAVVASTVSVVLTTMRAQAGTGMREEVGRNQAFLGTLLQRDLAEAGVGLVSSRTFGSVDVRKDTMSVLGVPFTPDEAPLYRMTPPAGSPDPLPPGGTCGATCITVVSDSAGKPLNLREGDVAKLQVNNVRHLVVVTQVARVSGDTFAVTFLGGDSVLHRPAAFAGGLRLDDGGTSLQRLAMVAYWREGNRLLRATRFTSAGTLQDDVLFEGVDSLQFTVTFTDGDEAASVSGTDGDLTNDYDDLVSIRINGTLESTSTHPRINDGEPLKRRFLWRYSPRNLRYERNRP